MVGGSGATRIRWSESGRRSSVAGSSTGHASTITADDDNEDNDDGDVGDVGDDGDVGDGPMNSCPAGPSARPAP